MSTAIGIAVMLVGWLWVWSIVEIPFLKLEGIALIVAVTIICAGARLVSR